MTVPLAVGVGGPSAVSVTRSTTGLAWTDTTSPWPSTNQLESVAYNAGLWAAVGIGNAGWQHILIQGSGATWSVGTTRWDSGLTGFITATGSVIRYVNGHWWLGGNNHDSSESLNRSDDNLATWSNVPNPFSNVFDIVWTGSRYVACGYSATTTAVIMASSDGVTWTEQTSPFDGGFVSRLAWTGTNIVAVGQDSAGNHTVMISPTGLTGSWTVPSTSFDDPGQYNEADDVYAVGADVVAVGFNSDSSITAVKSTDHGATWSSAGQPVTSNGQSVIYDADLSLWLVGGTPTTIASSGDLSTWSRHTVSPTNIKALAAGAAAPNVLSDDAAAVDALSTSIAKSRLLADDAAAADTLSRSAYAGVGPIAASRRRSGTATPSRFRSLGALSASRGRGGYCVPQGFNGTVRHVRWRLDDPTDGHNWVFETNPNSGGSPHYKRNVTSTPTTAADGPMIHSQGDDDLPTSSFTVILRTQAGFDQLRDWYRRCQTHPVLLTDDLGRRTYIVFTKRAATRKPGARRAWKMEYAVDYLIWQEVTA